MKSIEIKQGINRVCVAVMAFIGILSALQSGSIFVVEALYLFLGSDSIAAEVVGEILTAATYMIGYISAILIFKAGFSKHHRPIHSEMRLGAHPIPMISASLGISIATSHLVGYFTSGSPGIADEYHGQSIVLLMLTTVLVPAFFEELFFRGLIMTNLMPLGRNFAIIASGVIFGLAHGNHDQIFFATVVGIIFGWLYAETGTIWCGVIAHMLNNFISVVETVLIGTLEEQTAMSLCVMIESLVLVCGVASVIYLVPRLKREKKEEFSGGVFGKRVDRLLDGGARFTLAEYIKGFFSPVMIVFLCYVALNEVMYVFLF